MEEENLEPEEVISIAELLSASLSAAETEELSQEQPDQQPEESPEAEQSKAKPTKKRILLGVVAAVTAVALVIGAVFLFQPDRPEPLPVPVPDGGFFLLTKATDYNADGTPGFSQTVYTYDNRGFPLTISVDRGSSSEEVWNDDEGVYETIYSSFEGKIDYLMEFVYNEKGDILYRVDTTNLYDAEGNLTSPSVDRNDQHQNHYYHYYSSGRIDSVDTYNTVVGGGTGDLAQRLSYHYDDAGRVFEIFNHPQDENRLDSYVFDFRYDENGRLILASNRPKEGLFYCTYEYDDAGRLVRVAQKYGGQSQITYIDGDCVNKVKHGYPAWSELQQETVFTYDGDGQLTGRSVYDAEGALLSNADCSYENGQLSKVTFRENGADIVYRFADEGNGKDITLVRDINGNIIRQILPDGSYIEYEYQRFDLSAEDIQRAKNVRYAINRVDSTGEKADISIPNFEGSYAFLADIPYPTTNLYEIDILRKK